MSKFMLILHEDPTTFSRMSPEEMQRIVKLYRSWREELMAKRQLTDGLKLKDEGGRRMVRRAGKLVVTDGPYTEGKDVVGGVFIIEVASYDDAVALASSCPHLEYGEIEVREVDNVRPAVPPA
jgi:hypothetical protein